MQQGYVNYGERKLIITLLRKEKERKYRSQLFSDLLGLDDFYTFKTETNQNIAKHSSI
jgi:hypothetical protein